MAAITTVSLVFVPQYRQMDVDATAAAAHRILTVFERELSIQKSRTSDWANWDDTYKFSNDFNDEYVSNNLTTDALQTINASEFMIASPDGRVLKYYAAHPDGAAEQRPFFGIKRFPRSAWPQGTKFLPKTVYVGLVESPFGPVIVTCTRITDSQFRKESDNLLVLTRLLDAQAQDDIRIQSGTTYSLFPYRGVKPVARTSATLATTQPRAERSADGDAYLSRTLLPSPGGRAAYEMKVELPAAFTHTASATITNVAWILVLLGLLTGIFLLVIMRKVVTDPISGIILHLRHVSKTGRLDARLDLVRSDEIGTMANAFDELLAQLQDKNEQLEKALGAAREAQENAVQANQAKSMFISNISHELRTPLNAIIGFSDILSGEQLGPMGDTRYADFAQEISGAGAYLLKAINALIETARLDTGELNATLENVDVRAMLDEVISTPMWSTTPFRLVAEDRPYFIRADRQRARHVLLSIIENAIKYAPQGSPVTIGLSENTQVTRLRIEDRGPGMATPELDDTGDPFRLADDIYTKAHGGLGLGLSLSSRLMKLQEGALEIESAPGKGTAVTLVFRRATAARAVA